MGDEREQAVGVTEAAWIARRGCFVPLGNGEKELAETGGDIAS